MSYTILVTRIVNYLVRAEAAQDPEKKMWLEMADYFADELSHEDLVAFFQLYDELVK